MPVTVKKIDSSWWYNACKKCMKTAKCHGDSYKCTNPRCGTIGMPIQRFKLSILAGNETGDTDFILFGRQAQRLTRKTVDTLVAENPIGFIPDELTNLLERAFIWSVSFTDSTTDSGNITFQVNAVVGEVNQGGVVIPATPGESQTSSLMLLGGAGTSVPDAPQHTRALSVSSLPAALEANNASNTTRTITALPISEPPETPESVRKSANDKDKTFNAAADAPGSSSTKVQESTTKKRSRPSPNKKVSNKLFTGEEDEDGNGGDS